MADSKFTTTNTVSDTAYNRHEHLRARDDFTAIGRVFGVTMSDGIKIGFATARQDAKTGKKTPGPTTIYNTVTTADAANREVDAIVEKALANVWVRRVYSSTKIDVSPIGSTPTTSTFARPMDQNLCGLVVWTRDHGKCRATGRPVKKSKARMIPLCEPSGTAEPNHTILLSEEARQLFCKSSCFCWTLRMRDKRPREPTGPSCSLPKTSTA
jgi:hypothetical protein